MQVSNTLIIVAAEVYFALIVSAVVFFFHSRKLKSLVRRQQEKLLELINERKKTQAQIQAASAPVPVPAAPTKNYPVFLNREIEATRTQFAAIAPDGDIASEQPSDSPVNQRVLALRYTFLQAELESTKLQPGTIEYWKIFEQALTPLLSSNEDNRDELETNKKRIQNLEKFKKLFFDMEGQWATAKANAENYHAQLLSLSDDVKDQEGFRETLKSYHDVYNEIHHTVVKHVHSSDAAKTINITRQDPRAAEEIVRLRNVAADQHRIINTLQRKLNEATSPEERESVVRELQQQLQRQIRFVQESETCVQLLEEELHKVHEDLESAEKNLEKKSALDEENMRIKNTLHNFTVESKDMASNLIVLEIENDVLKQNISKIQTKNQFHTDDHQLQSEHKKLQSDYADIKRQYAELEEKYLNLKLAK